MTTIDEILGKKCIHYERQRVCSDCRTCNGRNYKCEEFLARPHREKYKPMIIKQQSKLKILPRNYQDWIRRYNDEGVIG